MAEDVSKLLEDIRTLYSQTDKLESELDAQIEKLKAEFDTQSANLKSQVDIKISKALEAIARIYDSLPSNFKTSPSDAKATLELLDGYCKKFLILGRGWLVELGREVDRAEKLTTTKEKEEYFAEAGVGEF